jgi:hypothetical protein
MKPELIGIFDIGNERIKLFLDDTPGGSFTLLPLGNGLPEMRIGFDCDKWWHVLRVLYHESFEFAMTRKSARFDPSMDMGNNHASYLFIMDHQVFSDVCGCVADFISVCQTPLYKSWKKAKKGKGDK